MSAKAVTVILDLNKVSLTPGLVYGRDLIKLAGISLPKQLPLDLPGVFNIAIKPTDTIFIRGGEKFSIGDAVPIASDYHCPQHPVYICFNTAQSPHDRWFRRAKSAGAKLLTNLIRICTLKIVWSLISKD